MNIILNARFFTLQNTGIGQYCVNLFNKLVEIDTSNTYHFVSPESTKEFPITTNNKHNVITIPYKKIFVHKDLRKTYWEQFQFNNFCNEHKESVVHVPYIAPPALKKYKLVLTVHDLAPLVFSLNQLGRKGAYDKYHTMLLKSVIKKVDYIIADSEYTKKEIIRFLNFPPVKIEVIYLAADDMYRPVKLEDYCDIIDKKYTIKKDYIFYLGDSGYRKNVSGLIYAYHNLNDTIKSKYDLVICGNAINSKFLTNLAEKLDNNKIKFIGYADKNDLPALYSAAHLFVFPTIYEGFGLPPLEAMQCGTPVISSVESSIPEVVGDAGILIDTASTNELTNSITKVIDNMDLHEELKEKSLQRIKLFNWEKTAKQTLEVYSKVYCN